MQAHELKEKITSSIQNLDPNALIELIDETHKHTGHSGFQAGRFHFKLKLQSNELDSLPRIKAHKQIFASIQPYSPWIHAFSIEIKPLP